MKMRKETRAIITLTVDEALRLKRELITFSDNNDMVPFPTIQKLLGCLIVNIESSLRR